MNYLLSSLLLVLLLVSGCESTTTDTKQKDVVYTTSFVASADQDTAQYQPLYLHPIPPADQLNAATTDFGRYGQVLEPPLERFEVQVLNKSIWAYEFYVDGDASVQQRLAGTGQWLQFRPDGTFIGGHWDRQTHAGAYYLDYQLKYPRITLDSNVDRLDGVWEIQAINGEQDAISFRRVPDSKFGPARQSVMAKLIEVYDRPTKQQFAKQYDRSQEKPQ